MNKKILMMGITPPVEGGSERHIYEISSRIDGADVLTQKGSICKNKIEVDVVKNNGFMRAVSFFLGCLVYSIRLLTIKDKRYETIHIHENLLYFLAPLLGLRYKIVITVHGMSGFRFYDNKLLWLFFRTALIFADRLIAVNPEDKKRLEEAFERRKVEYIPNGVDLSVYEKIKAKVEKKFVFIGRIHKQKGIIYLLEAFEEFSKTNKNFKLEIIGEINDYAKELQGKFRNKSIIWKGYLNNRKEIVKELKSAYCIVLPSVWEGLPLTLFEAMAGERPVIVSDIPAYRAVIKNEAVFFRTEDSKDLCDKMRGVIESKKKADEIGKKGAKLAERYDWNKIVKMIEEVYLK
jgi:glycosyltransferase involved in cell wall biosynthesis